MSVQTEIDRIKNAKTAISTAIASKGVNVPDGTKLDGMAPLINSIETGGAEGLDAVLTEQEALIAELQDTLRGKASGGGGDSTMEDGLITRTLTEYRNNRVPTVGSYALSNVASLEKAVLPMAQTLRDYAFANDTVLKRVDILGGGTLAGSIATSCLLNCKSIAEIIMRNESAVTNLQSLFFPFYAGDANITRSFNRSQWNTYGAVGRLENWSGLTALVKGSITYFTGTVTDEASKPVWLFGEYVDGSNRLKTLALVETEEEANALMLQYEEYFRDNGCKFYVPSTLVDSYKSATNWSIYEARIRAIEDYPDICGG